MKYNGATQRVEAEGQPCTWGALRAAVAGALFPGAASAASELALALSFNNKASCPGPPAALAPPWSCPVPCALPGREPPQLRGALLLPPPLPPASWRPWTARLHLCTLSILLPGRD